MNRAVYFNYIEERLGVLAFRINARGRLNILDLHNHSENFYSHFLNLLYGWQSSNLNAAKHNVEAIDLVDNENKLVVQVSATATKQKIDNSLSKPILGNYQSHRFKFVLISKDAGDLREKAYTIPAGIDFSPNEDILDNHRILDGIRSLEINSLRAVYEFVKEELGGPVDVIRLDSNLAIIINVLSKENLSQAQIIHNNQFQIDRKVSHNDLIVTKSIIEDFAKYHARLDRKYSEFDAQGANKSISVLHTIQSSYVESKVSNQSITSDKLLLNVIDAIREKVIASSNFESIPIDELDLCVKILVVDAFIRCKIFENPEGYTDAFA